MNAYYNHNYHLSGKEFKGWTLLKMVVVTDTRDMTTIAYFLASAANPKHEMIRVDITERNSPEQAKASLQENLNESMRPDTPPATNELAKVGELNFVSREPETDIPATINFTRGNVFISINSMEDKTVDVSNVASYIDQALTSVPAKGKMKFRSLKVTDTDVLIKNVRKAATPSTWIKVIVPDGELLREGDALIYRAYTDNKKQISAFAINLD